MELSEFFAAHPKVAVAFSGGVDSAYLLYAAAHSGADVCAYFVKTAFQPAFELADARRLAAQLSVPLRVLSVDILAVREVAENPKERCYFCKKRMMQSILDAARADGFSVLLDGTNASDCEADRAGFRALLECEIISPLRLCGLTKDAIRALSKATGLFTWDKPAYACLATRVPSGQPITADILAATEAAETYLAALGFSDFRVRWRNGAALLQFPVAQLPQTLSRREEIVTTLKKYYTSVFLDLEART